MFYKRRQARRKGDAYGSGRAFLRTKNDGHRMFCGERDAEKEPWVARSICRERSVDRYYGF